MHFLEICKRRSLDSCEMISKWCGKNLNFQIEPSGLTELAQSSLFFQKKKEKKRYIFTQGYFYWQIFVITVFIFTVFQKNVNICILSHDFSKNHYNEVFFFEKRPPEMNV